MNGTSMSSVPVPGRRDNSSGPEGLPYTARLPLAEEKRWVNQHGKVKERTVVGDTVRITQ